MKIDLKKEISFGGKGGGKGGRSKYPTKTRINLMMQDKSMADPKRQIALFVVFILVLGVFVKFMVVDKLAEAYEAQKAYEDMQAQISTLREINESSEEIKEKYSHYGYGYLNETESAMVDRMEVLNLIDSAVLTRAEIQSVDIAENVATITIDKIRLKTVSEIVAALEEREQVAFVTVSTAGTGRDQNATVSATMVIYFVDKSAEGFGGSEGGGQA